MFFLALVTDVAPMPPNSSQIVAFVTLSSVEQTYIATRLAFATSAFLDLERISSADTPKTLDVQSITS